MNPIDRRIAGPGRLTGWVLAFLWLFLSAGVARAASEFDQARKAYDEGRFGEAVSGFERSLQGAPGGVGVLYNLGNARFRQGEMGRALAAWRQAQWITPRDPALRHNLDLIRRRLGQSGIPVWRRWLEWWTLDEWGGGAVALVWAWSVWGVLIRLRPGLARIGAGLRGLLGGFAALVVAGWIAAWVCVVRGPNAAIAGREVVARYGPLEESEIANRFTDGAEVRVEEHRNGWVRVSDAEGRGGWIQGLQVARYHPWLP
jgi:tetratricopeptide (TPR) repeat protein